jgi:hypothetical protein
MAVQQERGLDALLNKLPPDDAKEFVKAVTAIMKDAADSTRETVLGTLPDILRFVRETLGYTDSVLAEVEDLTNKTGDTREDLLLKALTLYEAALEATQKGQRLVLVGPDYRFIQEIVGIDRVKPEAATSGTTTK